MRLKFLQNRRALETIDELLLKSSVPDVRKAFEILSQEEIQKMISCTKNIETQSIHHVGAFFGHAKTGNTANKTLGLLTQVVCKYMWFSGKGKKHVDLQFCQIAALDYKNSGIRRVLKLEANEFIRRFCNKFYPVDFTKFGITVFCHCVT